MMDRTEKVELTVMCLITDGDRILLQKSDREGWRGYVPPGGHVEPGESFVDAVIRETKEETGLDIDHPRLVGIKQFPSNGGRYVVMLFRTEEFSGELTSSDEGKMEWIETCRISELETVDGFDEMMRVFNEPELTELQYVGEGDRQVPVLH